MRVLVTGSGGREHALVWACARGGAETIVCAPGNAGTADVGENVPVAADAPHEIAQLARDRDVDLVVLGPDASVAAGVADACRAAGITVFGPSAAAGKVEYSKTFGKELMDEGGVPTPAWRSGTVDDRAAILDFARELGGRCVVKADGLALGNGVTVCDDNAGAAAAVSACFDDQKFGGAGARVIVEERLQGPEISVFAMTDGEHVVMLPPACDYKRAEEGDRGGMTGGVGTHTPPTDLDVPALLSQARDTVIAPILEGLRRRGTPYLGCLYAGLMLTRSGVRVLEYNARFGDPETQALVPLTDNFLDLLVSCANGGLGHDSMAQQARAAVTVVASASGYPGKPRIGDAITLPSRWPDGVFCFLAGSRRDSDGVLRTAGGRVLAVTGIDADVGSARALAYRGIAEVHFDGMQRRGDIGARAIQVAS